MIKHDGLDEICKRCKKLGFDRQAWVYLSAAEVGAHHKRKRWFFMATRGPMKLPRDPGVQRRAFRFLDENVPRLTERLDDNNTNLQRRQVDAFNRMRISSLGNGVVPAAVAAAWNVLVDAIEHGHQGEVQEKPRWLAGREDPLDLQFGASDKATRWTTPVHTVTHWFPQIEFHGRNKRVLATQVFHERGTRTSYRFRSIDRARQRCSLNPEWVEALMGFPIGWTR